MVVYNDKKFREMVVYIAEQSRQDVWFGAVKLNKILYYCDFTAYRELGRPISGATYRHLDKGPVAREYRTARGWLKVQDEITIDYVTLGRYRQERFIPQRPADVSVFSVDELAIIDRVIANLRHLNAAQLSDLTHDEPGWRLTREDEIIPYQTAWLAPTRLTPAKVKFARELAANNGVLG